MAKERLPDGVMYYQIRVPRQLLRALKVWCAEHDKTMAEVGVVALTEYLERQGISIPATQKEDEA